LRRIQANLGGLEILGIGDIVETASRINGFNKLYLSNAVGCFEYVGDMIPVALQVIAESLPRGGLAYIAGHESDWKSMTPEDLCLDEELTRKACELEEYDFWSPRVFRKV